MISRISFIFSFFWAHEVPILPLTLFFENRLDWIESLWLLFLSRALLSLDISPAGRRRTPQRNQQRHRSSNPCRGLQHRASGASCSACAAGGRAAAHLQVAPAHGAPAGAAACSLPAGGGAELPAGEYGVTTPRPPAVRKITGSHRINSHVAAGEIAVT